MQIHPSTLSLLALCFLGITTRINTTHAHAHVTDVTTKNDALSFPSSHEPQAPSLQHRSLQTETAWTQLGQSINGLEASDQSGWDVAISDDGTRVAVASPLQDGAAGVGVGSVRVFDYGTSIANQWTRVGNVIEGAVAGAGQGHAVDISGDGTTIAVGAIKLDSSRGYVRVYRFIGGSWDLLTEIEGTMIRDRFGGSVSLNYDGTRVAAGAFYHDGVVGDFRGQTQIWEQGASDTEWVKIGEIEGEQAGDRSGHSVALSGDGKTVAIGELSSDPGGLANAGSVTVWQRSSSLEGWIVMGEDIPGISAGEQTGYSVDISFDGLTVAVGSPNHSSQVDRGGMARVFSYTGSNWIQMGPNIFPPAPVGMGKFGHSVSLSSDGSILLVGEPTEKWVGKVSVYQYNSQDATPSFVLDTSFAEGNIVGRFGSAVDLSGDGKTMIVGSYLGNQAGANSGTSRVYQFETSDWTLSVVDFESNFGPATDPEFVIAFSGVAPTAAAGRTYRTEMLIAGCSLGAASDDAVYVENPTGNVPNAINYNLSTNLRVDTGIIQSSGFFVDKGSGMGELAFCVKMEVLEGSLTRALDGTTVKAERLVDITVQLDMSQDFMVTDFVSRDGRTGKTDIRDEVQFNYGFTTYFCDEFGTNIEGSNSNTVVPGGVVSVCLEANDGQGVKVIDVKDVNFGNSQAPLLGGVEIIDSNGDPVIDSTIKDCDIDAGKCRIEAVTVPRLYEYVDSSGQVVNVAAGANMNGMVVFGFASSRQRARHLRHLQQQGNIDPSDNDPTEIETRFRKELNLASPPDRTNGKSSASSCALSLGGIAAMVLCLAVVPTFLS